MIDDTRPPIAPQKLSLYTKRLGAENAQTGVHHTKYQKQTPGNLDTARSFSLSHSLLTPEIGKIRLEIDKRSNRERERVPPLSLFVKSLEPWNFC